MISFSLKQLKYVLSDWLEIFQFQQKIANVSEQTRLVLREEYIRSLGLPSGDFITYECTHSTIISVTT